MPRLCPSLSMPSVVSVTVYAPSGCCFYVGKGEEVEVKGKNVTVFSHSPPFVHIDTHHHRYKQVGKLKKLKPRVKM